MAGMAERMKSQNQHYSINYPAFESGKAKASNQIPCAISDRVMLIHLFSCC